MKILLLSILFFCGITQINAQDHRYHNQWMWGYDSHNNYLFEYYGGTNIDFSGDTLNKYLALRPMNLTSTLGVMCDTAGSLLFYTNGIYIANIQNDTMNNGGGINPGYWADQWSADLDDGYRIRDGMIILPDLSAVDRFRLFHLCMPDSKSTPSQILTTQIDMSQDNGFGGVIEKNTLIYENSDLRLSNSFFNVVRHANGRDWWLVSILHETQELLLHLYTTDSIYRFDPQPSIFINKTPNGQCQFSPDGSRFASGHSNRRNPPLVENSLHYYTFDRCTGVFTPIFYEFDIDIGVNINGVAFSPSGRYLYRSFAWYLFRYDTEATDILATKDTIAVWDTLYFDPANTGSKSLPVAFGWPELGPDGNIYVMSGGATPYIHQILYPDDPSKTEVIQNIPMPTVNAFTVPNFPNYNLGVEEGSPCEGMLGPPTALYDYEAAALAVTFEDQTVVNPHAWHWTFGDGVTSSEQHPQHTYAVPGTYTACLSASNLFGNDTYCREIKVETTSIHTLGSVSGMKVVPNPASDQVVIELAEAEGTVYLYDLVGRQAATISMRSGTATLALNQLPPGLYTVKLLLEDGREVWDKLLVE
jgi:hypothetical protein